MRHLPLCAPHILPMVPRCLLPFPSFPTLPGTSTGTHQQPTIHHPWLPSQLCGLRHLSVRSPKHLQMVSWCHSTRPSPASPSPNPSARTRSHPKPTIYGAGMPGELQGLRHMSTWLHLDFSLWLYMFYDRNDFWVVVLVIFVSRTLASVLFFCCRP